LELWAFWVGSTIFGIPALAIARSLTHYNEFLAVLVALVGVFGGMFFGRAMFKKLLDLMLRRGMARFPKQDFQTIWGKAAYFSGERYYAIHWNWLKLLAQANPECLSIIDRQIFGVVAPPKQM
jgi:hypothetical protein